MKTTGKIIAWGCIFSTLSCGCYTTSVIDPRKVDQKELQLAAITEATTSKGSTYSFEDSYNRVGQDISVTTDSLVGFSNGRRLALPLPEVSSVSVREFNVPLTVLGVGIGVAAVVGFSAALGGGLSSSGGSVTSVPFFNLGQW